jgi:hypothetical protein
VAGGVRDFLDATLGHAAADRVRHSLDAGLLDHTTSRAAHLAAD